MTHASLFSGIGGFDLAAEWSGFTNVFNCEWEEFPRKVLKHHFPKADQHGDIKEFNATQYNGRVDILSGGFPCQPFSVAGKRKGTEDERYLWKEMLRVIGECKPRWVLGENVRGLVNWSEGLVFETCCSDLEAIGYSVQSFIIPCCAVNAPHRRDRVWIVAKNTDCDGRGSNKRQEESKEWGFGNVSTGGNERIQADYEKNRFAFNSNNIGTSSRHGEVQSKNGEVPKRDNNAQFGNASNDWEKFPTVSPVCGRDDGIPKELDGITFPRWRRDSIKGYGNAIVPQVAHRIFESIKDYESMLK